jgi:hypothetical protein
MIDFEQDMYEQIIIWCHNDFDGFIAKWNEGESRFYGYITGMAKRMLFRSRKIAIYTGWEFRKKDLDMYNDSFQIKLTENDGILTEITN